MIRFYWAVPTLWLAVVSAIAINPISPNDHPSVFSTTTTRQGGTPETRPNFVVILTDDLDISLGSYASSLQRTRRLIGKEGVTFTNWFVQSPVCCMSVSTIFDLLDPFDLQTSQLNPGTVLVKTSVLNSSRGRCFTICDSPPLLRRNFERTGGGRDGGLQCSSSSSSED
jgi:hypothetical protein